MSTSDYINRAFRPEPGRKYWNHMATHSPGEWHRHWLLSTGQYIRTSSPDAYRFQIVGEPGPELVNFRPGGVAQDPRLIPRPGEHIIHPDGRAWTVGES